MGERGDSDAEPTETLLSRLPPEEAAGYTGEQRRALLDAYRAALEEFGDEDHAIDVARAAARGTPGDR